MSSKEKRLTVSLRSVIANTQTANVGKNDGFKVFKNLLCNYTEI